jgi:hypothetical protein
VINRLESTLHSSHFCAATIVSFWLALCQAHAQSRETAFGLIRTSAVMDKSEQFTPSALPDGRSMFHFWSRRSPTVVSAIVDSTGSLQDWASHYMQVPFDEFLVVEFPSEHRSVGVAVDKLDRRISFITNLNADTLRAVSSVQVPVTPAKVVFGDLNNDNRTDFIVVDRESPGAFPFFGLGNEKFRQGKVIAEDNAIADVKLTHLNNDGILDLVCYDWIRSRIHLLYGVGQGKFLDQMSYQVAGEVRNLEVAPLGPDGNLDIVVAFSYPPKFEILRGDGLGDFKLSHTTPLRTPFVSFTVCDVNGDGYRDIVGLDGSSILHAFLNGGDGSFEDRLDFVGGRETVQFALTKGAGRGLPDAQLFERGAHAMVTFMNGQTPSRIAEPLDFATGVNPQGVTIADVDGNGTNDVAVVSAGSNSISFYLNDGQGALFGPTSYLLPAGASELAFHSFSDSVARFLISYPEPSQVSVLALNILAGTATNATIPTQRASGFLYWDTLPSAPIEVFCFSRPTSSTGAMLTLFQEIESHQFIEKSFRLPPSNTLLGAGVGLLNNDQLPDVAFVHRIGSSGKHELAVSYGDTLYSFRQKQVVFEAPDKGAGSNLVWIAPASRSGGADILLYEGGGVPVLERFRQVRENTFSRPDTIASALHISDESQLQFVDFDSDGETDIVLRNAANGTIGWLRGSAGSFAPFVDLCAAPGRVHFAVGDLNGDKVPDIAVTYTELGILRIHDGISLLRKTREKSH